MDQPTVLAEAWPGKELLGSRLSIVRLLRRVKVGENALEVRVRAEGLVNLIEELRQHDEAKGGTIQSTETRRDGRTLGRPHSDEIPAPRRPETTPCTPRSARWALLAPDIVDAILAGRTDQALLLEKLERPLPASWEAQRSRVFGPFRS